MGLRYLYQMTIQLKFLIVSVYSAAGGSSLFSEAARDLMSADMQREMLREKWEKEQRDLLDAQETVHYANVQFDGTVYITQQLTCQCR